MFLGNKAVLSSEMKLLKLQKVLEKIFRIAYDDQEQKWKTVISDIKCHPANVGRRGWHFLFFIMFPRPIAGGRRPVVQFSKNKMEEEICLKQKLNLLSLLR